ncbi:LOB domain protein [Zostera marina]|uniref:LOB domain protein n=1 Tax=Zostera marina TaxID=29655 RepID=A0A0K9NWJ4_ZOSMR|nr:LOB domain protein [Zostera marina]
MASSVTAAAVAGFPSSSSSSSSPCAACKFLRRKCQPDCVFAPYFPPHNPGKFSSVHKVFGASNVTKILNELKPHQRDDAVNSLAFEADMRLRDPVYGCVGLISFLQHQLREVEAQLHHTKLELSMYEKCNDKSTVAAAAAGNGLNILLNHQPVGVGPFQPRINHLMHGSPYHDAGITNNMTPSTNVAAPPTGLHFTFAGVDGRHMFIGPT